MDLRKIIGHLRLADQFRPTLSPASKTTTPPQLHLDRLRAESHLGPLGVVSAHLVDSRIPSLPPTIVSFARDLRRTRNSRVLDLTGLLLIPDGRPAFAIVSGCAELQKDELATTRSNFYAESNLAIMPT